MSDTTPLGYEAKIYRNTASYASPTWSEMTIVKNVGLSLEKGEADATTRGNNGWRATLGALKNGSLEVEMIWTKGDTNADAIISAFTGNTQVELAVMDGDITTSGNSGLRASFEVLNFNRQEDLEDVLAATFTLKPGVSANAPAWYEVP